MREPQLRSTAAKPTTSQGSPSAECVHRCRLTASAAALPPLLLLLLLLLLWLCPCCFVLPGLAEFAPAARGTPMALADRPCSLLLQLAFFCLGFVFWRKWLRFS